MISSKKQMLADEVRPASAVAASAAPAYVVGRGASIVDQEQPSSDKDISSRVQLLAERQKLRQQGVPEEEINMVLPISPENAEGTEDAEDSV